MKLQSKSKALWKEILARIAFPLLLFLGLFMGYQLMFRDNIPVHYSTLIIAPFFLLIGVLERVNPYKEEWNSSDNDIKTDVFYLITRQTLEFLMDKGVFLLIASVLALLPQLDLINIWPHHWNPFWQFVLLAYIYEFYSYWEHRLHHKIPILWRLHAVHHSPNRLYFNNAPRFHIIELIIQTLFPLILFYLLGVDPKVVALLVILTAIHGLFQHANIYIKIGYLNYVFSMAELHRWHHSKLIEESDTNFGANLIFWDLVFGTFFWPKEREVGAIGVINDQYPKSFTGQFLAPFVNPPIDKPKDFYERKDFYENLIKRENK